MPNKDDQGNKGSKSKQSSQSKQGGRKSKGGTFGALCREMARNPNVMTGSQVRGAAVRGVVGSKF